MGMFDEIKCEYPLPEKFKFLQNKTFQTKDFYNVMDEYTITKNGKLVRQKFKYEVVEEKNRPYFGTPEWNKSPFSKMIGSLKKCIDKKEMIEFHGYIRFCTVVSGNFYEFTAKFTDGKLVKISPVELPKWKSKVERA